MQKMEKITHHRWRNSKTVAAIRGDDITPSGGDQPRGSYMEGGSRGAAEAMDRPPQPAQSYSGSLAIRLLLLLVAPLGLLDPTAVFAARFVPAWTLALAMALLAALMLTAVPTLLLAARAALMFATLAARLLSTLMLPLLIVLICHTSPFLSD